MALWTDVIDPATLTGYTRASLEDYEASQGSLARWLPNRDIQDTTARFVTGQTGLIDVADFRAYDAEPTIGRGRPGQRKTIELPALGRAFVVSEYEQIRAQNGTPSDPQILAALQNTARDAARAAANAIEYLRGVVLTTGRATINGAGFRSDDDFGRPAEHDLTATDLWTDSSTSRLDYLQAVSDVYEDSTGTVPGCILMSRKVFRALAAGDEMRTAFSGGSIAASEEQVRDRVRTHGLPEIVLYNRRVSVNGAPTRVLPEDRLFLLPEPVDANDFQGTDLGATFWGRTLTSTSPEFGLADVDQPGIVVGAYRNERPPMIAEIVSDAIALPVLANAERSLVAKVL